MELSQQEHREIDEVSEETGIKIYDSGYSEYYGTQVYKVWPEGDKKKAKIFWEALKQKGFKEPKCFIDNCMICLR